MVSLHSVPHARAPVLFPHGHGPPGTPAPAACADDAGWLVGSTTDEIQFNVITSEGDEEGPGTRWTVPHLAGSGLGSCAGITSLRLGTSSSFLSAG